MFPKFLQLSSMTFGLSDIPMSERPDFHFTRSVAGVPATRVLDVPVSTVDMKSTVAIILDWVNNRNAQFICVRDVHGIMRAQQDPDLLKVHEQAGLVTPDGMPLVWLSHLRGYKHTTRVCGSDLVAALCDASQAAGVRHFFYGGKPGVAERMAAALQKSYPQLQIVGTNTPPFGLMSVEEDQVATGQISASGPDIVWVGLSTPKQEYWMRDHVGLIPGATLIGIGAAFDFYAGDVKRAPRWMHSSGLEWSHRLFSEPRRLWRRYLVLAPQFVLLILKRALLRKKGG